MQDGRTIHLPCQLSVILWKNAKARRALRRASRQAEDAGRLTPGKDDHAAKGGVSCGLENLQDIAFEVERLFGQERSRVIA